MRFEGPQVFIYVMLLVTAWYSAITYLALRRERRMAAKEAALQRAQPAAPHPIAPEAIAPEAIAPHAVVAGDAGPRDRAAGRAPRMLKAA